ncbi:MAG TPA: hypothetical protein VFV43_04560, partial [Limnobacter sp.]|nr:hypothetical protein [Limnobacter sp.]
AYTPDPAKYILAQVLTNDRINGILTVTALATAGTGTFADWTISLTAAATTGVTVLDVSNNAFYRVLLTDDVGSVIRRGVNGTQNLDYNPSTGQLRSVSFSGELFGNAATATLLQNSRLINGTSFNGGADITTASWGTARNLTIGNTAKSVDGSTNYSWSLAEIGAPATNGTGATGTWPINITGSAASATTAGSATSAATATDATNATNVNVTTTASNANFALVLSPSQTTGLKGLLMDSSGGTYNPATNTADFNISGNAATAAALQTARNINGVSFNGTANISINLNNSITFNNGGGGAASGSSFNGGGALTVSYNTVGAPSTTGANASGTWGINITGNAATATTATNVNGGTATVTSGTVTGGNTGYQAGWNVNGDITANRGNGTGVIYLGNSSRFLFFNGTSYEMPGANLLVNGSTVVLNNGGTYGINISGTAQNANTLNGFGSDSAASANTVMRRDGNGYAYWVYGNQSSSNNENPTISQIMVTNGGDNFLRKASLAHLGNSLNANGYQFVTPTTGSPAYYGARAWVNFNGTGTPAIRAAQNVSSITDNGVGDYTINFTTAMADAEYSWSGSARNEAGGVMVIDGRSGVLPTASALRVNATRVTGTAANVDVSYNSVIVFR